MAVHLLMPFWGPFALKSWGRERLNLTMSSGQNYSFGRMAECVKFIVKVTISIKLFHTKYKENKESKKGMDRI